MVRIYLLSEVDEGVAWKMVCQVPREGALMSDRPELHPCSVTYQLCDFEKVRGLTYKAGITYLVLLFT